MGFVIVLACTVVLAYLLRKPLAKAPVVFYALGVALCVLYLMNVYGSLPRPVMEAMFLLMQKCTLALALFTVVMFIGVFRKDSKVGLAMRPVRAELSILACILTAGHMIVYLMAFLPRISAGTADGQTLFFLATALVLLLLVLILGITSFREVKRRMNAGTWKRVQRWAYVFFGLIYVHMMSILLPSALKGASTATVSIIVYTVLFALYAVLRIRRALLDRRDEGGRRA